jgi:serine/threonine-protein kinase/endoribonuclease IRE1
VTAEVHMAEGASGLICIVFTHQKHHYQDLPENVRRSLGEPPAGFLSYFTKRFPKLLLHVHSVVRQYLAHEPMFTLYFDHDDS